MKIAFQMDPIEGVNPKKDNTLWMMEGALERGHEVYYYTPDVLSLSTEGVFARMRQVTSIDTEATPFFAAQEIATMDVRSMDVVLVRQDPPFDMRYITKEYTLEHVMDDVLIVNNPVSVDHYSEKIIPFAFKQFMPKTLITEDVEAIGAFIAENDVAIIKPLYLFGGSDVFKVSLEDDWQKIAMDLIEKTGVSVVVQQFIPEVVQGDKRILLIDGEVVGAFLRVPQADSVVANIAQGGAFAHCELTENDMAICDALKPFLKEHDLTICGIDVIGNYLTEVNVTSPMGFKQAEEMYGTDISTTFWDVIERKAA